MARVTIGYFVLIGSLVVGILLESCAKAPAADATSDSNSMPSTISTDAQ